MAKSVTRTAEALVNMGQWEGKRKEYTTGYSWTGSFVEWGSASVAAIEE